ncbi:glycoside hydrolase/deacetylase [Coprinopsis marcescibilis]|uniref:Glycoside hydrolase/deacetylase n=1 Tax=Coprinopsis marcescibilis TaxID=230819 RepID=A0A5C3KDE0_COPMA|nr:glycoside hydrolase/deacetylase [Coprinopsis marcescibilis]
MIMRPSVFVTFVATILAGSLDIARGTMQLAARSPARVYGKCTVPNSVALTFDDGPYVYLNDLVTLLNRESVKGTFFFNGNNWACIYNPSLTDSINLAYHSGHQIASHTWGHKRMTNLTWDKMHDEMWRVEQALLRILGVSPAFMRPPYGEYNPTLLEAASMRNQSIVNWDFDSEDGKSATVVRQKALYDEAIARRPSTILSLQHEVHNTSVYETLPYAIRKLKAAGYKFLTVAECLGGLPPYGHVGKPEVRNANWTCNQALLI